MYKIAEHSFNADKTFGYRFYTDKIAFEDALVRLYEEQIIPNVAKGLCGAVYTQLTDVEDETNGLMTYDRRVVKVDTAKLRRIASLLQNNG